VKPEDFRRRADQLDVEAEQLARAGQIRAAATLALEADRLRLTAKELEGLTGVVGRRTVRTDMIPDTAPDPAAQSSIVKRARSRSRRNHPAQEALYLADVTIQGLADYLKESRARVSHWMAEEDASKNMPRPIPKAHADRLHEGVQMKNAAGKPVTLRIPRTAWRRIGQ
jgi:hypothetical protein